TMIDHSKTSLDTIDRNNRHISGITMGVSRETYEIITKEIEAFKDRLKIIVNNDNTADRIYQLNVALFPISKIIEEETISKGDT
ncbi:MAG: TIGR02147 family protein, partial [Fibrobacterota bacterium]